MRTSKTLSVSLPPAQLKRAERLARRENRTLSELVREALRQYEQKQEAPVNYDVIAALRAIQGSATRAGLDKLTETEIAAEAFIDAEKRSVDEYYERSLELVRPGGLILVDNVLWDGAVIDPSVDDPDTRALRLLNLKAGRDKRVEVALVPVCDGLLIARLTADEGS